MLKHRPVFIVTLNLLKRLPEKPIALLPLVKSLDERSPLINQNIIESIHSDRSDPTPWTSLSYSKNIELPIEKLLT